MPRVITVEKARKADPRYGIEVGDKYYYWVFKNQRGPGTKVKSKTYPRPSQLTRSNFKSQWRSFGEEIADLAVDDGLYDALQEIAGRIRELGEECQSSLDNMPEGLQQGSTGEMLQERIDNCDSWASEIEGLDQPELEEIERQSFDEFLDEQPDDQPQRKDFGGDAGDSAAWAEFLAALHDWATGRWADWEQEFLDACEQAVETYNDALEAIKEEAINADPGEV
jgi:hypothetical protein